MWLIQYEQRCYGTCFVCDKCTSFFLCFKCYRSKEAVHPQHSFEVFKSKFGAAPDVEENQRSNATEAVVHAPDQVKELGIEDSLDDEVVSNDEYE